MENNEDAMRQADGSEVQDQNEGLGIDQNAVEASSDEAAKGDLAKDDDPMGVKKRLGMQAKKHQREMRQMQEQLARMQEMITNPSQRDFHQEPTNPYHSPGQPDQIQGGEEERIRRAVSMALGHEKAEKQRALEAEKMAHVHKQYQQLNNEFDKASEKYEDFDDVVRGNDVPFTPHIRDALLLVDNPSEVAYKLGKNRSELSRISELHPLDQAREVNRLSMALMRGDSDKPSSNRVNPISAPRVNPASNSSAVNDKTPVSSIRARMKANTWK